MENPEADGWTPERKRWFYIGFVFIVAFAFAFATTLVLYTPGWLVVADMVSFFGMAVCFGRAV